MIRSVTFVRLLNCVFVAKQLQQFCAVEEDVDVTRARDLNPRNFRHAFQFRLELFGDRARRDLLARGLFDQFRELERNGKRNIAELRLRRRVGGELLQLNAKNFSRGRANSFFKLLLQVE